MIAVCLNLLKKYNKSFDPLAGVSPSASVKTTRLSAIIHVLSAPPTPLHDRGCSCGKCLFSVTGCTLLIYSESVCYSFNCVSSEALSDCSRQWAVQKGASEHARGVLRLKMLISAKCELLTQRLTASTQFHLSQLYSSLWHTCIFWNSKILFFSKCIAHKNMLMLHHHFLRD